MDHLKKVERNQDDQTVNQNTTHRYLTPTMIKVGAVVFGLLLIGTGLTLYFLHVNAIAAYVTGGVGGAIAVGVAIWSLIGSLRGKNASGNKNKVVSECTLDRSKVEGNPTITQEQVNALLSGNPKLKKLRVDLRPHSMDTNWDPDFKALEALFTLNIGQSSGTQYVYDRK